MRKWWLEMRSARRLILMLLVGANFAAVKLAFAGDPGGNKTGGAADAQNAAGESFIVPEPKPDDPPEKKRAYDEYKTKADKEPLAVTLADSVGQNRVAINLSWTLLAGFLVMFMQAGFALVETGFCRAKNAAHTMLMNFMIYVLGLTGFWIGGFSIMYGAMSVGALGGTAGLDAKYEYVLTLFGKPFGLFALNWDAWFLRGNVYDVGVFAIFLFQMVFMDTAATIPTGAMAERWKLKAFFVYGFFMSMILYPVFGNWAWGGGWLSTLGTNFGLGHGYVDFAGSGVVHSVGGLCGLAGAIVLGPRIGKYNKDGSMNAIPGHHIPMALLGTLILAFGWFGFNPGSTLGVAGGGLNRIGIIATVTMLASAGGALAAAAYMIFTSKKPDPTMVANGMLAGLVAITAPSGFVGAPAGFLIGLIAGVLVCLAVKFFDKVRIDDPVGAISVHGVCGLFGVLCVGIFADGTAFYTGAWNGVPGTVKGLVAGDVGQFFAQCIGCVTLLVWAFGASYAFFTIQDKLMKIRVSPEVEIEGLDLEETGVLAYPAFAPGGAEGAGRLSVVAGVAQPVAVIRPVLES